MAEPEAVVVESTPAPVVASGEPTAGTVDKVPDPASLKAELEELQRKRDKAREDATYWRQEKARARADFFTGREVAPAPPVPVVDVGLPPKKESFDDYDKYVEALTDWKVAKKAKEWEADQDRKSSEIATQNKIQGLIQRLDSEGMKKYADFEDVARDPTLPITPVIRDVLAECEAPEDVAYYLGKNRQTAVQLSRMSPIQAARAVALIEQEIKTARANVPQPKITTAPPPINPLGSANTVIKDLEKMSQPEFEAEMERRTGRRF